MFKLIIFPFVFLFSSVAFSNVMITPLSIEMDINKPLSSYTIENKSADQQTYAVKSYFRTIDENGREVNKETKEIRVFPNKILLNSMQSKRIKVMYLGKKTITDEKAYRVVFEPVTVGEQAGVKFNYKFVTSVYVTPEKAEHNVIVKMNSGKLYIQNLGNKHEVLNNWGLVFNQGTSGEVAYKEPLPPINMLAKSNVVLPLKPGIAPSNVESVDILALEK